MTKFVAAADKGVVMDIGIRTLGDHYFGIGMTKKLPF